MSASPTCDPAWKDEELEMAQTWMPEGIFRAQQIRLRGRLVEVLSISLGFGVTPKFRVA